MPLLAHHFYSSVSKWYGPGALAEKPSKNRLNESMNRTKTMVSYFIVLTLVVDCTQTMALQTFCEGFWQRCCNENRICYLRGR
jgi:hypothetical protein